MVLLTTLGGRYSGGCNLSTIYEQIEGCAGNACCDRPHYSAACRFLAVTLALRDICLVVVFTTEVLGLVRGLRSVVATHAASPRQEIICQPEVLGC